MASVKGRRFARPGTPCVHAPGSFIQRGQVDGAQRGNFAVQAVDFALQALQAHVAVGDGFFDGLQVGLGVGQQRGVLLQAQARGLFLELEFGDALAQRSSSRVRAACGARRARSLAVRSSYSLRWAARALFAFIFRSSALQAALRRGVDRRASSSRRAAARR